MNNLWKQYMRDLVGNDKSEESMLLKILKADLHGAIIKVLRAKCKS